MINPTKNDEAWQALFKSLPIIEEVAIKGYYFIDADQIRVFREPRLMTKFDHHKNLPSIFKQNHLNILPISRGGYIIGRFENYHKIENQLKPIKFVKVPVELESLDVDHVFSEAIALNIAFVTGILADFSEEDKLYATINGRMSSAQFEFEMKTDGMIQKIGVEGAQVEIDGGYEGKRSLLIIEAKNCLSSDFLIRQLYYPYRLWQGKCSKKVRPIFMTYSNGLYSLYEYRFEQLEAYHSIKLVKYQQYSVISQGITKQDLIIRINALPLTIEQTNYPFPQANNFQRIIHLCELLKQYQQLYKHDITQWYDFDDRQTDYYTNAAAYLGLMERAKDEEGIYYYLTTLAQSIMDEGLYQRNIRFIECILSHEVFMKTIIEELRENRRLDIDEIVTIMKASALKGLKGHDTFKRRASTIKGWMNYIHGLVMADTNEIEFIEV